MDLLEFSLKVVQHDTVMVLPTGYRKLIIFHIAPWLLGYCAQPETLEPIVLILSPLNALLHDQIKKLCELGVNAGVLAKQHLSKPGETVAFK